MHGDVVTRIVAGTAGGRRLRTPDGDRTRPTSDRVREALFSTVESMVGVWDGLHVLDLYAGSGALGLEALSRGAERVVFVESHRRTATLIETNARELELAEAVVFAEPVEAFLRRGRTAEGFDLVFADPPYAVPGVEIQSGLAALVEGSWLNDAAVLVVERGRRSEDLVWPPGLEPVRSRTYGETTLWYGRQFDTPSQ
jgi:16S rRNA (guanine966-N2)-methyltransferase